MAKTITKIIVALMVIATVSGLKVSDQMNHDS